MLSLEGNTLAEAGVLQLAASLHGHRTLREFSLANQRSTLSSAAMDAIDISTSPCLPS